MRRSGIRRSRASAARTRSSSCAAAGVAAVIGFAARVTGAKPSLVRDARWIAAIGANASAPLLISDLGRPERFLNMLRVFKPQSAMSVGAWALAGFGACSTGAVLGPRVLRDVAAAGSALFGLVMSTYTGVLLGATAIPAWNEHAATLPVHFAASALASATSLLELRDHDEPALNALAALAAAFETWTGYQLERRSRVARAFQPAPGWDGGTGWKARATRETPSTTMR